jgi:hypothetical protein
MHQLHYPLFGPYYIKIKVNFTQQYVHIGLQGSQVILIVLLYF